MIFDEVREHLVILAFYRAQSSDSEALFGKKTVKFEANVIDTLNFHRIRLI